MRLRGKGSMDISPLNATKPAGRMGKSISVPNGLALSSPPRNRTITVNGEQLDVSKIPPLPPMQSINPATSKREEFDAVRRKLIGSASLSPRFRSANRSLNYKDSARRQGFYNGGDEDDDIGNDDEEDDDYDEDLDDDEGGEFEPDHLLVDSTGLNVTDNRPASKHHDFLNNSLGRRLSKHLHQKPSMHLHSSTPNHSDSSRTSLNKDNENGGEESTNSIDQTSTNADQDTTENQNKTASGQHGIFSTLMNTLNLKSFTDLANHNDEEEDVNNNDDTASSSVTSETNTAKNEPLSAVNFVPIKKALITTLGQGSLTLDAFPKNQTQLLHDQNHLSIPDGSALNNSQGFHHLKNYNNDDSNSSDVKQLTNLNFSEKSDQNQENTRVAASSKEQRSRPSLSPLPRKPTIRNSLTSIMSSDEEEPSAPQMSNSLSFKKKLKLPLASKRQSLDSGGNTLSRLNSNIGNIGSGEDYPDQVEVTGRKKEFPFEKLDLKPPSDKRQEAFHTLFPSLPANEVFIEDFACAYRKEILVQGKLYLSEHHISFHSNIIGLVTRLTIPLNAILKIQKKKTVGIPNAIEFSNLHNKYIFASFMSRDPSYDLIYKVWKSNINNEGIDTIDLDLDDEVDSLDTVSVGYSDDEDGEDYSKTRRKSDGAATNGNDVDDDTSDTSISDAEDMVKDDDELSKDGDITAQPEEDNVFNGLSFEGPKLHAQTSAGYSPDSSETKIIEENVPAPMGLIFELMFGADPTFMKNLLKVQKNFNIGEIPKFVNNKRTYHYTKPVNGGPVGPKQTKCIVEESIEHKDFSKNCLIVQLTESPDVPSGNAFKVKTKIFLSWGPQNATNILIVTTVVWTGKSWIKSAIERGAISGQKEALGILVAELKKKISSGGTTNISPSKVRKKDRNKKQKEETPLTTTSEVAEEATTVSELEPKTYTDLILEQVDLKLFLIILLFVIVITDKFKSDRHLNGYELYSNNRMLMSESSLWEWIEQRELMADTHLTPDGLNTSNYKKGRHRNRFKEPLEKASKQRMSQQELKDTIDMMELQLRKLKEREHNQNNLI
ncbi:hypothetical protein PMKS-002368 [Pichia membranifaciens]|uniref:VASt domain-containing protein n=1 Tax=Pichia membranifaciens TaxID=4926 RepID=A0A1Q2YH41_9ASCO|nr:hypothetical protein PMKS-002368 [Pichia membranifaciens]